MKTFFLLALAASGLCLSACDHDEAVQTTTTTHTSRTLTPAATETTTVQSY